jgi:NAD(P)-dependent dehydrogenase (short-subunit alcohol dehydrogenase family)
VKTAESFWSGKLALVTGGASFISSTLTDQLLARGARVRVVDELSSGHLDTSAEAPKSSGTGEISAVWLMATWDICSCVLGAGPQTGNSRGHRP